jgi:GDP-mannose 6-dehydrogenase
MKLSIFGLGYVGSVTAGCLGARGHHVIGVDVQEAKVSSFASGISPIVEKELPELLSMANKAGKLSATMDADAAVAVTDISIVCVGTPSLANGRLNLDNVRHVTQQIAHGVAQKATRHTIVYRSTMLPGSVRMLVKEYLQPLLDDNLVEVFYCPEFLREGRAVHDFDHPSLKVLGSNDGAGLNGHIAELFGEAEMTTWEEAEMIKYACNSWHAVKVTFANEIGRISKHLEINSSRVMGLLCKDKTLNISSAYLKPGTPFGGSCLPKDLNALTGLARIEAVSLPLIESTLSSNENHLATLLRFILNKPGKRVGLLGLSFKEDTDDLRGSPMVSIAETLLGRGYQLKIYDPQINLQRLVGANQSEINRRMPHLAQLLCTTPGDVIEQSDVVIVSQHCCKIDQIKDLCRADQHVVDVNGWSELASLSWKYEGLCW